MPPVFVDIDGTIIRGTSCEKLFLPFLVKRQRLGPRQFLHFAWFALRHFRQYGFTVYKRDKAYLTGLPVKETEQLAGEFIELMPPDRLNLLVMKELEDHRASGDELVLLSGMPEFLALRLGQKLGIGNIIACKVPSLDGFYTSDNPVQHPYGPSKLELALEYCQKSGVPLDRCTAYADKFSDLPLLEKAGTPVAVTPGRSLRKIALTKDWRIIE